MEKIKVEIVGLTPILMHSPKGMLDQKKKVAKSKLEDMDYEKEAEKVAYRKKDGELYVPSEAIFGTILNGATYKKAGKFALKPLIAAGIRIDPYEIGLGTKKYEIDLRTVVIRGHGRILRARPMMREWKLKFDILYNKDIIQDPLIIKDCLKDAGERIGILDFSPRNKGPFGTFKITKFSV